MKRFKPKKIIVSAFQKNSVEKVDVVENEEDLVFQKEQKFTRQDTDGEDNDDDDEEDDMELVDDLAE